jgi:hypothetical protein
VSESRTNREAAQIGRERRYQAEQEQKLLDMRDGLDAGDHSERAAHIREAAASVDDHRSSDIRRAANDEGAAARVEARQDAADAAAARAAANTATDDDADSA